MKITPSIQNNRTNFGYKLEVLQRPSLRGMGTLLQHNINPNSLEARIASTLEAHPCKKRAGVSITPFKNGDLAISLFQMKPDRGVNGVTKVIVKDGKDAGKSVGDIVEETITSMGDTLSENIKEARQRKHYTHYITPKRSTVGTGLYA